MTAVAPGRQNQTDGYRSSASRSKGKKSRATREESKQRASSQSEGLDAEQHELRNDQGAQPYGKTDVQVQPPVWKLINLIEFADRLVQNDTFAYDKMLDFLSSLSRFEDFPDNLSYNYFKKLSTIIQDVVLDRLESIEDRELRFRLHKNLCLCLAVMFKKRLAWDAFKWVRSSLTKLALSTYLADSEHCSAEHAAVMRECGKMFIRRMATASLGDIFSATDHLTLLLREEASEKWTAIEILEEEVNKLKVASQAQGLASMHVQK